MVVADGGACGGGGGSGGSCLPFSPKTQLSKPSNASQEAVTVKKEQKAVTCKGGGCDRSSSSSSSTASLSNKVLDLEKPEEEAPSKVVHIKVESIDVFGHDVEYGRDYSSSSSMVMPKPMECLHESGPPPFVNKTFQMVDDPDTDPIVSWSESRESFIVWDSHEFSKTLLPKYFKHSNFSSFIRQLNTYGFKKVDPDRWEFANEGFQGGKKHLLKNIKRRSRYNKHPQGTMVSADSTQVRLEDELETLKNDQDFLKLEIMNLRQQRKYSQHQLTTVEERIRNSECKQQRMLFFLIKIAKNPTFVQQSMQKRVLKRELDGGDLGKRRRLLSAQGLESFAEEINRSHSVNNSGNQHQEQLVSVEPVLAEQLPKAMVTPKKETPLSAPMVDKSCNSVQNQKPHLVPETSTEDMPSVYLDMSEKLLGENSVFDEEFAVNDSNFYQELEDLIAKPRDWSGYVSNCLVEQAGCIGSMP